VLSFSDEGYASRAEIETLLAGRGHLTVIERQHARYVGARIGIYNPRGEKVGQVSHLVNRERLYVSTPEPLAAAIGADAAIATRPSVA